MPARRMKSVTGSMYFIQWVSMVRMMRSSGSRVGISEEVWLQNKEGTRTENQAEREEDITPEENISLSKKGAYCLVEDDMSFFDFAEFIDDSSHEKEGEELYEKEQDRERCHA